MQRMQTHMRWLKVARDLQFLKENGTYIICKTESWLIKYSIKKKISESLTYICMYQSPQSQNYFMLLQIIHGSQSHACQRQTDNLIENRNLKVKYLLMMLIFKAYGMLSSEMIFSCRVNCFCTCLLGELQGRQTMSGEKVFVVMPQGFFFLDNNERNWPCQLKESVFTSTDKRRKEMLPQL